VCFAILLIDEASGFAEVYGINNKNDLVDALSRYCQGVVARDMQPQFARFDAGSEVTRHGELTGISSSLSGQAPQHHNLTISTGNQKTNPAERMADHSAPHGQHVPAAGEPHQAAMVGSIVCSSGHG
jgi:hypothetical protein